MDRKTITRLGLRVVRREAAEKLYLSTGVNWTRPNDIRATLTERCNFRCRYCDHWRQDRYADEMSLVEWQSALLSIRDYAGRFTVQFIGGEPTIWPDFDALTEFADANHIGWGVITNGSTLKRRARRLVNARPTNIDISIDGLDHDVNDWSRGVPGSLHRILDGFQLLLAARADHGRHFPIRIKPVILRQTIDQMVPLARWVADIPGVSIDFNPVRLWRQTEIAELYPVLDDDLRRVECTIEQLLVLKEQGAPIETSAAKLRAIGTHFRGGKIVHAHEECRVGLRSMDIRPNGDVNHCWNFHSVGNLREQSAREIWEGAERHRALPDMLACPHATGLCGTACTSHRSFTQDVKRGLALLRQA